MLLLSLPLSRTHTHPPTPFHPLLQSNVTQCDIIDPFLIFSSYYYYSINAVLAARPTTWTLARVSRLLLFCFFCVFDVILHYLCFLPSAWNHSPSRTMRSVPVRLPSRAAGRRTEAEAAEQDRLRVTLPLVNWHFWPRLGRMQQPQHRPLPPHRHRRRRRQWQQFRPPDSLHRHLHHLGKGGLLPLTNCVLSNSRPSSNSNVIPIR